MPLNRDYYIFNTQIEKEHVYRSSSFVTSAIDDVLSGSFNGNTGLVNIETNVIRVENNFFGAKPL